MTPLGMILLALDAVMFGGMVYNYAKLRKSLSAPKPEPTVAP